MHNFSCFRNYYKVVSTALYMAAVASVLYCQDAIFKLNFIIVGVFVIITLHQLFSPKQKTAAKEEPNDLIDDLKTSYDKIKTVKGFISK